MIPPSGLLTPPPFLVWKSSTRSRSLWSSLTCVLLVQHWLHRTEAVTRDNFGTIKCSDYEDAVAKKCGSTYSSVRLGADTNAYMVDGDFYVPVNSKAPFGNIN